MESWRLDVLFSPPSPQLKRSPVCLFRRWEPTWETADYVISKARNDSINVAAEGYSRANAERPADDIQLSCVGKRPPRSTRLESHGQKRVLRDRYCEATARTRNQNAWKESETEITREVTLFFFLPSTRVFKEHRDYRVYTVGNVGPAKFVKCLRN